MPWFERDAIKIYYEQRGDGFPILLFAPGGMQSRIERWQMLPWRPAEALAGEFRTIVMDQRNAGQSSAPVCEGDGWNTYTDDHIALLDHLGIGLCHLVGCCIGGSFILNLLQRAPERVASAVLMQPIGHSDDNAGRFDEFFNDWMHEIRESHPNVAKETWDGFRERMFGSDFVFSVSREQVKTTQTPMLVLMGNDLPHPSATSREIVELAPNARLIERWKESELVEQTGHAVTEFLRSHTR